MGTRLFCLVITFSYLSPFPRMPLFSPRPRYNDQVSTLTGDEACRRLLALRSAANAIPATPLLDTSNSVATATGEVGAAAPEQGPPVSTIGTRRTVSTARHLVGHVVVLGFPARCAVGLWCWWW